MEFQSHAATEWDKTIMQIRPTAIPDVVVFEPDVFGDERGFFLETYRQSWFDSLGINPRFVQGNHSKSEYGILRGMHLQTVQTQGKLVRVTSGEVYDVAVDLRLESKTYGQWVGEYISAENYKVVWVPEGFAHGFLVTSPTAEFVYQCTDYYNPKGDISLAWNDPTLGIEWPVLSIKQPKLSAKDTNALAFVSGMGFSNGQWIKQ